MRDERMLVRSRSAAILAAMTKYLDPEGFAEWEATVPESFKRDPIWRTPAYRYGVWLSELAKGDAQLMLANRETRRDVDQFLRAVGGISSNLAEGYSAGTGRERARYYGYARATSRESRDWYFKARAVLGNDVVEQRHAVLERIIRILTAVIPRERGSERPRRRNTGDERRSHPKGSGGIDSSE